MGQEHVTTDLLLKESVEQALKNVKDPEIPAVSIVDLGMVYSVEVHGQKVFIQLLPTFVGCPALDFIKVRILEALGDVSGIAHVSIQFVMSEPWSSDRISSAGIEKLRAFGIAGPLCTKSRAQVPDCPYCGATNTKVENLFGPTACRAIFYCNHCHQPFEGMKRI